MYKFKLLGGTHAQEGVPDEFGRKVSRIYQKGDTVESPMRLDQLLVNKFQLIGGGPEEPDEEEHDPMEDMTVSELRAYAEEQGIDVSGVSRKADLLKVIRDASFED